MRQTFRKSKLPIDRDRLRQVIADGISAQTMLRGRDAALLIETDMGRISPSMQPIGPDTPMPDEQHAAAIARVATARRCAIYADQQGVRVDGSDRFIPNATWQGF
ncbi:hypothetical protein [Paracoccus sp. SY]|uniref:hypothetical protein n=1 Tax=Paracoccus sp. SY TaxID=1330255 RepID=UPI000CD0A3E0|nr:hypothetical protein [Paracoccus sp. SY]